MNGGEGEGNVEEKEEDEKKFHGSVCFSFCVRLGYGLKKGEIVW